MSVREQIGGNNPPSAIDHALETTSALSAWMAEHPVVSTEEDARAGKLLVDRAKDAYREMETERINLTAPLNQQVKEINGRYYSPKSTLENILQVLTMRLDAFAAAEEQKRQREAEEKRKLLEAAERDARAAEEAERDAKSSAESGELGVDLAKTTQDADAAFALYKQAQRESKLADRLTKVKLGGGFRRSLSRRDKEILTVDDHEAAIGFLGLTDRIKEAILTEARTYRQEFKELPPGIGVTYERSL